MGSFGERLRDAMIARGVGVSELGKRCCVTRQTVARWFRMAEAELSGRHLLIACELLQVRARWLVLGIMPMVSDAPDQERNVKVSTMER